MKHVPEVYFIYSQQNQLQYKKLMILIKLNKDYLVSTVKTATPKTTNMAAQKLTSSKFFF